MSEGKRLGKYMCIKQVGKGAFGTVFLAKNEEDGKMYAIKSMDKKQIDRSTKMKELFRTELGIMNKINHPNCMHLFDFLESTNNYYLIMQFCNNGDLEEYMKKKHITFFKEPEALFFLKQIMLGFEELHSHKIMHRDFKLPNLFMNDDTLLIGDFGLAKSGHDLAQTNVGTPLTKAPELSLSQGSYTSKADLWSIGVVFYQMLFGDYPFMANSEPQLLEVIKRNAGHNLKLPRHINNVSQNAEDLIRGLLTIDPRERLDWNGFFNHPIFSSDDSNKFQNHFLITNQSCINVNNNFTNVKKNGFRECNENINPLNLGVGMNAREIPEQHGHTQGHNSNEFDEICYRYLHERNKIAFIYQAVKHLRNIFRDPSFIGQANYLYTLLIGLARKGIILADLNILSLKKKNNIFGLSGFDQFCNSSILHIPLDMLTGDLDRYKRYLAFLATTHNEVHLRPDEEMMMGNIMDGNAYLPDIDVNCKRIFAQWKGLGLPGGISPHKSHEYFLALAYGSQAISSEASFPYIDQGRKFDWETYTQRHVNMSDDMLNQMAMRSQY